MKAKPKVKKAEKKVVSSIIEITKKEEKPTVDGRSLSLQQYHSEVAVLSGNIVKYALSLSKNMLSVKMALMQSVQSVEKKMKENRG